VIIVQQAGQAERRRSMKNFRRKKGFANLSQYILQQNERHLIIITCAVADSLGVVPVLVGRTGLGEALFALRFCNSITLVYKTIKTNQSLTLTSWNEDFDLVGV
jgi:hypothetical protein